MPTAAKMIAAITFAFIAWFASRLVIPYLPEGQATAWMGEICALMGFLSGWRISGAWAGTGMRAGIGFALTTVAVMVFWSLLIFAGEEMFQRSLKIRYDGPVEALAEMMQLFLKFGQLLFHADVLAWLGGGALFGAWVSERTARAWS